MLLPVLFVAAALGIRRLYSRVRHSPKPRRRPSMVVLRKAPVVLLHDDAVQQPDCSYEWECGASAGLPIVWEEDLMLRRN